MTAMTQAAAGRLLVTGTAELDLRDAGIRVPQLLVGRHVTLRVEARLSPVR